MHALTQVIRKLGQLFQNHKIIMVTSYPLKSILSKLHLLNRNNKTTINLTSCDMEFELRIARK